MKAKVRMFHRRLRAEMLNPTETTTTSYRQAHVSPGMSPAPNSALMSLTHSTEL